MGAVYGEDTGAEGGYVMVPFVGRDAGCRSLGVRSAQGEEGCGGLVLRVVPPGRARCGSGNVPATRGSADDLVGLEEEGWWDGEVQGLGRLEVDDQLEFYRPLHRQVGGLGAFEALVHEICGAAVLATKARPIRHEPASVHKFPEGPPDRGQLTLGSKGYQACAMPKEERVGKHDQRFDVLLGHPGEGALECTRFAHLHAVERHPHCLCRLLERFPRLALDWPKWRHREHTHAGRL